MPSFPTEQRQERLRSIVDDWVCRQTQGGAHPLHCEWSPKTTSTGEDATVLLAPFSTADSPQHVTDGPDSPAEALRSKYGSMGAVVGTLSVLSCQISSRCEQVYHRHLPAILTMGISPQPDAPLTNHRRPPAPQGRPPSILSGPGSPGNRQPGDHQDPMGEAPAEGESRAPGASTLTQEGEQDPEISEAGEAQGQSAPEDAPLLGSGENEGLTPDETQETEAGSKGEPQVLQALLVANGQAPDVGNQKSKGFAQLEHAPASPQSLAADDRGDTAHVEAAQMLPSLHALALVLQELTLLLENLLLQLDALYPPPAPPQGFWGAMFAPRDREAGEKQWKKGRRERKTFSKFQGRVHMFSAVHALTQGIGVFLAVEEALKFNSAVSHGLSSFLRVLMSAPAAAAAEREGSKHKWGGPPSLGHVPRQQQLLALQGTVAALFAQLFPTGGLFAHLCGDLRIQGFRGGAAPGHEGFLCNESLLVEVLGVANESCALLLTQTGAVEKRGSKGPFREASLSAEMAGTRLSIAGHVALLCVLCGRAGNKLPSQDLQLGPLPPKRVASLIPSLWEAATKIPLLHVWGPLSVSPLQMLSSHLPSPVLALAPKPLGALSQVPARASLASLQGALRVAALEACSVDLAQGAGPCCDLLSKAAIQLQVYGASDEMNLHPEGGTGGRGMPKQQGHLLLRGVRASHWALSRIRLLLDLHSVLQRPLPASRILPVCALLLATSAFVSATRAVTAQVHMALALRETLLHKELREHFLGLSGEVESKLAKAAASAHSVFFGTVARGTGGEEASRGPASGGATLGGPHPPPSPTPSATEPMNGVDSSASSVSGDSSSEPRQPDPLALLSLCMGQLSPPPPPSTTLLAILSCSVDVLWGLFSPAQSTKRAVCDSLQALQEVEEVRQALSRGGASEECAFLLWQMDQLLPILIRALLTFPQQLGANVPSIPPGEGLQRLLDCFVLSLSLVHALPCQAAAQGARESFEARVVGILEGEIVGPLARDIEADLRLHVHSVRLGNGAVKANPRKSGLRDLSSLLGLPAVHLVSKTVSLRCLVEERLQHTLFNAALLSPPGTRHTYLEMRRLARSKYGLRTVPEPILLPSTPSLAMSLGADGSTAEHGVQTGPGSLQDVVWVLGNLQQFLAICVFNAASCTFSRCSQGQGEGAKVVVVLSQAEIQGQLRGLDSAAFLRILGEAAGRVAESLLLQMLHLLGHDTLQTLLLKEGQWWDAQRGVTSAAPGETGAAPLLPCYPLHRAEAFLASLSKVRVPVNAIGRQGEAKRQGKADRKEQEVLLVDVLADVVSQLGTLVALLEVSWASASAGLTSSPIDALLTRLATLSQAQAERSDRLFLMCPALLLHHARSGIRAARAARDIEGREGGGAMGGGVSERMLVSDGVALGVPMLVQACAQGVRLRDLRWFKAVRRELGERIRAAEVELKTSCRPPVEQILWGKPVEVVKPERAHHLQGVLQEASETLGAFVRVEAIATRASAIMQIDV